MGDIDNSSDQDYYTDYTYLSTDLNQGQSGVEISVTNGNSFGDDDLGIWIDWNQDGDFNDVYEEIVCAVDNGATGTYYFDVPGSAVSGTTRMRVRIKYNEANCGDPCGTSSYGEVEDYSVNVVAGISPPVADFEADNLTPAISERIFFTDLSTNSPTSWTWVFTPSTITYTNGTNANSQHPKVRFNEAGYYTVSLTAANSGGSDTETKVDYIFVASPPVADFEDNLTPALNERINFSDLSTGSGPCETATSKPLLKNSEIKNRSAYRSYITIGSPNVPGKIFDNDAAGIKALPDLS